MNEKSGRRLLSFVFTLAMVVGLLSGMSLTALAANESVASVTSGGTTSYYSSFSEAVSALGSAAEGATLKLLEDSSTASKLSFTGSKTFDLNGKTLTSTASDSAILLNADNAVLTVTDSSDSKNGKITFRSSANSNKEQSPAITVQKGTLTVNSGTVKCETGDAIRVTGGTLKVTGGVVEGAYAGVHVLPGLSGNVHIEGGKIIGGNNNNIAIELQGSGTFILSGNAEVSAYHGLKIASSHTGSVTINGGTINAASGGTSIHAQNSIGKTIVSGGTFNGLVLVDASRDGDSELKNVEISGGHFNGGLRTEYNSRPLISGGQFKGTLATDNWGPHITGGVFETNKVSGISGRNSLNDYCEAGYIVVERADNTFKYGVTARPGKEVSNPVIQLEYATHPYTGSPLEPSVTVKETVDGPVIDASEYNVAYYSNTNAGTAEVRITDKEGGNYSVSGYTTFEITKADPVVVEPKVRNGLKYDGSAQKLIENNTGTSEHGSYYYRIGTDGEWSKTIEARNAGLYDVYYCFYGDNNHKNIGSFDTVYGPLKTTIAKKAITIASGITAENKPYDGTTDATLNFSGINWGACGMLSGDNLTISGTGIFAQPNVKNNIHVEISDLMLGGDSARNYVLTNTDNQTGTTADITPGILTKDNVAITFDPASYTYTGQPIQVASLTVKCGPMNLSAATDYEVEYTNNINAGEDTAILTLKTKSGSNFSCAAGDKAPKATFSIRPAPSSVTKEPKAIEGLIYNKKEQALITAGAASGGTMQYAVGGKNNAPADGWSSEIPQKTNAGTYYVWYQVQGDSNHANTEAVGPVAVTIAQKELGLQDVSVSMNSKSYPYTEGGVRPHVTVKYGDKELSSYDYDVNYTNNINVDPTTPAQATIITRANSNYSFSDAPFVQFWITKADSTPAAVTAKNSSYSETGEALVTVDDSTLVGGTMWYALGENGTSAPDFDGTSDSSDKKWSTSIPKSLNVGTYYVWSRSVGDANHNDTDPVCVTVTISQASIKNAAVNLNKTSFEYTGAEQSVTVSSVKLGKTELTVNKDYEVVSGTTGTARNIYTVTVTGKGNYKDTATALWSIGMAEPIITTEPKASAITYGQSLKDSTLTGGIAKSGGNAVAGTFTWKNPDTKPYVSDSEKTEYAVVFTPEDTDNYAMVECKVKLTVMKGGVEVTAPAARTLTYNGQAQDLVTPGKVTGGTMQYALGTSGSEAPTSGWSTTVPTATNRGTYIVYYRVVTDENHEDKEMQSLTSVIGKGSIVISADDKIGPYPLQDDMELTYHIFGSISEEDRKGLNISLALNPAAETEKDGLRIIPIEIKSITPNENYEIKTENGKYTVTGDEKFQFTANGYQGEYDGSPHGIDINHNDKYKCISFTKKKLEIPQDLSTKQLENYLNEKNETDVSFADVGTHTAYYYILTNKDELISGTKEVVIAPKPATVFIDAKSKTYGEKDPELTFTAEGLVMVMDDDWVEKPDMLKGELTRKQGENAGTYPILEGNLKESNPNYDLTFSGASLTITKAASKVAAAPQANTLTQTGAAQALVIEGKAEGGTMQYALGKDDATIPTEGFNTAIPTAADAGIYYIWYKVIGDGNHKDSEAACVTAKIEPGNGATDQKTSEKSENTKPAAKKATAVKIKTTKKTIKSAALKKKAVIFKIKYSKTKGSGKATFKKLKGSKRIKVGKTGKIKVLKGTKMGLYKIKVKVSVAENAGYKAKSAARVIKIKIKK